MSDEIKFTDNQKRYFILFIGIVAISLFIYMVFITGASYGCSSGGGYLLKNYNGTKCVNLSSVDLCRDYSGRVIEKPKSKFNFSIYGVLE